MSSTSSTTPSTPDQPIALRPDHLTTSRTTLLIKQNPGWSHGDFIAKTADGATILTSSGKVLSNSARKDFQDSSGLPLFSLRRAWLSLTRHYWLELPGGQEILTVRQLWSFGKIRLDFRFKNAANQKQEELLLEVRGRDGQNMLTDVVCNGKMVALIRRQMDEKSMAFKFLPEWRVEVAEGVDIALISVMVIVLAELVQNHWDTTQPRQ